MTLIDTNNIAALIGADVIGSDDRKIGTIGQIYVDASTDQPSWVTINTGLFGMSESFAPLEKAEWNGEVLRVAYEKSFVKDAPRVDDDGSLDAASEDALYQYYTVSAPSAGRGSSQSGDSAEGSDTSSPRTDDAMTRSEEQLRVGTEEVSAGRARLRKHIVTENQTITVPVSHEEVTLEREPITDANAISAADGPALSTEEHEVQLTEERVVVEKKTVPVERVRLGTETVTEEQQVTEEVRKEQIDFDDNDANVEGRRSGDNGH